LALIAMVGYAQTIPITAQREGETIWFEAQAELAGFRAALYDLAGNLIAESGPEATKRWSAQAAKTSPGDVYLCVFWLRGSGEATKRLARLEVQSTTISLQTAEQYLAVEEKTDDAPHSIIEMDAIKRKASARSATAIPFFRTATKVLPDESAAYVFLVRAMRLKYAQIGTSILGPLPSLPPPPARRINGVPVVEGRPIPEWQMRVAAPEPDTVIMFSPPFPTPEERQEILAAAQKAVAVANTCPEKTAALRWLAELQGDMYLRWVAMMQGDLWQQDAQISTLEQIAETSCASNVVKAQSLYNIGLIGLHCTSRLTARYEKSGTPYRYRKITKAADQRELTRCLPKAIDALERALTLCPYYGEAWWIRHLLYHEQLKTTASPAERKKLSAAADEAARRAMQFRRNELR
jgi:hypothetical protein